MTKQQPSFFPTPALDHAAAGLSAGVMAVLCMHPLDLLKVKFQVATSSPQGGIGKAIVGSLVDIQKQEGLRGLYRGIIPNIAGNASSWGLYFLFYNMLKKRASVDGDLSQPLTAPQYLLCSAQASAVTAIMTNPIWVVKVRMFTSKADSPTAYRGLWDGLTSIYRHDGVPGLFRGTTLALFGVTNGSIQFMAYEELKKWGFKRKEQRQGSLGRSKAVTDEKLSNTEYTIISATAKLFALASTYPYQVVRSRLQNNATSNLYPTITATIQRTWTGEGIRGFYRGLGTNLVRVLPGTCITFVVYENLAWLLRTTASKRAEADL